MVLKTPPNCNIFLFYQRMKVKPNQQNQLYMRETKEQVSVYLQQKQELLRVKNLHPERYLKRAQNTKNLPLSHQERGVQVVAHHHHLKRNVKLKGKGVEKEERRKGLKNVKSSA